MLQKGLIVTELEVYSNKLMVSGETSSLHAGTTAAVCCVLLPVMTTVRFEASTPSVTCSAVEADPNPLAPGLPVMSDRRPI